ncbi:hypothetical protein EVAR_46892_1 [Eumeta japonica]|uniref:Uncharacterized protein n=1 Tax=Eumeta variegata TaxID=151549 RepID=A0A4C1YG36_EUMVA|nr:hypothetical protein EVAR_46892_1 [Eumeta japonica]
MTANTSRNQNYHRASPVYNYRARCLRRPCPIASGKFADSPPCEKLPHRHTVNNSTITEKLVGNMVKRFDACASVINSNSLRRTIRCQCKQVLTFELNIYIAYNWPTSC